MNDRHVLPGGRCAPYGKAGNRCLVAVVGQRYAVNVMDEHVLRGNAAIIKCHIPSFVAEFVEVDSWIEDVTTDIYPSADYGTRCATYHLHIARISRSNRSSL